MKYSRIAKKFGKHQPNILIARLTLRAKDKWSLWNLFACWGM